MTSAHSFRQSGAFGPARARALSRGPRERETAHHCPTAHLALRDRVVRRVPRISGVPTGPLCLHPTLMYDVWAAVEYDQKIGANDFKIGFNPLINKLSPPQLLPAFGHHTRPSTGSSSPHVLDARRVTQRGKKERVTRTQFTSPSKAAAQVVCVSLNFTPVQEATLALESCRRTAPHGLHTSAVT